MEFDTGIFGLIGWAFGLFLALGAYLQGKAGAANSIAEASVSLLNPLIERNDKLEKENTLLKREVSACKKENTSLKKRNAKN